MKIYKKIKINIDTLETVYEDSFEYDGDVAFCLGGGDPSVEYTQSPEQRMMYQMFMPVMANIASRATGQSPSSFFQTSGGSGSSGNVRSASGADGAGNFLNASLNELFATTGASPGSIGGFNLSDSPVTSLWEIPNAPSAPTAQSMSGVYSGVSPVNYSGYNILTPSIGSYNVATPNIGTYNTPDVSMLLPQKGWMSGIDTNIMAGIEEPWNRARNEMFETLGTNIGSARGGFSGAAGAALGEFQANKAANVGLQAWEMMQPGLMADYNAQLQRNRDVYGAQTAADMWSAEAQTGMGRDIFSAQTAADMWGAQAGTDANKYLANLTNTQLTQLRGEKQQERYADYANRLNQQQQDYQTGLETWRAKREEAMFPYTVIPAMMGGTYSNPVVNPGTNVMGSLGGGALGLGSAMMMGANPLVAGLMGLGGLLGGK